MDPKPPGQFPLSDSSSIESPETLSVDGLVPETWEQIYRPFPVLNQSCNQAVKRFDRVRAIVVVLFVSVLGLLCARCVYSAYAPSGMLGIAPTTATQTPKAAGAAAVTVTPWIVYKFITPVPSATPLPTQTARVVYVNKALPTYTPYPTMVSLQSITGTVASGSSISREGACWVLNLYGVSGVWVDATPVAPAYGYVRVCGVELKIR